MEQLPWAYAFHRHREPTLPTPCKQVMRAGGGAPVHGAPQNAVRTAMHRVAHRALSNPVPKKRCANIAKRVEQGCSTR